MCNSDICPVVNLWIVMGGWLILTSNVNGDMWEQITVPFFGFTSSISLTMSDISEKSVALPAELKVGKFAEARVKEILELRSTIGESPILEYFICLVIYRVWLRSSNLTILQPRHGRDSCPHKRFPVTCVAAPSATTLTDFRDASVVRTSQSGTWIPSLKAFAVVHLTKWPLVLLKWIITTGGYIGLNLVNLQGKIWGKGRGQYKA